MPVLVRVTVCAVLVVPTFWPAKVRLLEERLMVTAVPVPVRGTLCGLPAALSVKVAAADSALVNEGVKVTLSEQLLPAATELPQVLLAREKSLLLVPVTAMLVMDRATLPVFVSVTVCAALVVPTP